MTTRRKLGAAFLRILGVICAVGMPSAAVLETCPFWRDTVNRPVDGKSLGVGGVMFLLIALFGFRRQIWPYIQKRLSITAVGALLFWGMAFVLLLALEKLTALLPDLRTICIAGLIGTAIGQVLDTVAGLIAPKGG